MKNSSINDIFGVMKTKKKNKVRHILIVAALVVLLVACACLVAQSGSPLHKWLDRQKTINSYPAYDTKDIPLEVLPWEGLPFCYVNDNIPTFTDDEKWTRAQDAISYLDELGRCGAALSCIGRECMPEEARTNISSIKPTGWRPDKYDFIDGGNLYNRCHLIGYQLSGDDAIDRNLITGTRFMNEDGMLPFENAIASYVRNTGNHVMYRVTPIFVGEELVARGVHMEALSVEDNGKGICFNVFCYNAQPGVDIDYMTGRNSLSENRDLLDKYTGGYLSVKPKVNEAVPHEEIEKLRSSRSAPSTYVINMHTGKFHLESCKNAKEIGQVLICV